MRDTSRLAREASKEAQAAKAEVASAKRSASDGAVGGRFSEDFLGIVEIPLMCHQGFLGPSHCSSRTDQTSRTISRLLVLSQSFWGAAKRPKRPNSAFPELPQKRPFCLSFAWEG